MTEDTMGLWDSIKDFGGGRFDGEMTPSGSGARIRAGVRDLPVIGDVNLVDVQVPGFAKGGVVPGRGPSRAQAASASQSDQRAKLAALQHRGGATAPTGRSSSSPTPAAHTHRGGGGPAHGIGAGLHLTPGIGMGGRGGQGLPRQKHEIAPGVPCPTCMTGETKPVR
ncbi:hypothetical protein [Gordonia alkanivorans]|uniref:hypothetical protein n=1 Tax=Gordonia alkanivorans TaxID=84096 RepID=UPI00244960DA|nr:hypothetical protein [Gordonia alkanivorans]MDH3045349.1 hypothetical protein [Gordonia alkanivorans]